MVQTCFSGVGAAGYLLGVAPTSETAKPERQSLPLPKRSHNRSYAVVPPAHSCGRFGGHAALQEGFFAGSAAGFAGRRAREGQILEAPKGYPSPSRPPHRVTSVT